MVLFNESLSFSLVYVVSFRISLAFTNTLSLNFSRNIVFQFTICGDVTESNMCQNALSPS